MRRLIKAIFLVGAFGMLTAGSCDNDSAEEKVDDATDAVTDGIEDAGDDIEDATD